MPIVPGESLAAGCAHAAAAAAVSRCCSPLRLPPHCWTLPRLLHVLGPLLTAAAVVVACSTKGHHCSEMFVSQTNGSRLNLQAQRQPGRGHAVSPSTALGSIQQMIGRPTITVHLQLLLIAKAPPISGGYHAATATAGHLLVVRRRGGCESRKLKSPMHCHNTCTVTVAVRWLLLANTAQ